MKVTGAHKKSLFSEAVGEVPVASELEREQVMQHW